jgi:hypothetical protein
MDGDGAWIDSKLGTEMELNASHMMRVVTALVIFLVAGLYLSVADAGHDEPRLIIIGDSISTTHESWPNRLRYLAPRWNIHLMAQNGRSIRDFSLPRDLWTPGDKNETVIYFLGANDMMQRNDVMHARYRLKNQISFLLDRNFKVLLVIPPRLNPNMASGREAFEKSTEQHRALMETYRGTHPNLTVFDVDQIWDNLQTYDGVHPKPGLSNEIALHINWVLGTNIY